MDREQARMECERLRRDPLKATVEAKPKPPQSDDAPLWHSAGGLPPYAAG